MLVNEIATSMQSLDEERSCYQVIRNELMTERKKLVEMLRKYDEKANQLRDIESK